jgi:DNA-binding HxlR family transcriptional regulator
MTKKTHAKRRSDCPLSVSLEVFGDRWSLLIVRDLMFKERHGYKDFLQSEEKVATNILTDRLKRLECNGIVEKQAHADDARKVNYQLTAKGIDLAPVLIEMILWAARYEQTAAPPEVTRRMTKNRKEFLAELRNRWKVSAR